MCTAMATRSRTSQQAQVEVRDAIRELTSTSPAASSGGVSIAHAAKAAAIAAAEALRTDSHYHVISNCPAIDDGLLQNVSHCAIQGTE